MIKMNIPPGALKIIEELHLRGFEAYLAGGCVRDMFLGRKPKDFDIATSAKPDDIKRIFDKTILVGESFGVIRVIVENEEYEVATFRSDGNYSDGRRPDNVKFSSAEEDVKRRDLTINALLYDPVSKKIIDLVGGQRDIQNKLIKTVGSAQARFAEDRLRMLRTIRFAAQLDGFKVDESIISAIAAEASLISLVSKERIAQEMSKIWTSNSPANGWKLLAETCMLQHIFPQVTETWEQLIPAFALLSDLNDFLPDEKETLAWALIAKRLKKDKVESFLKLNYKLSNSQIKDVISLLNVNEDFLKGPWNGWRVVKALMSPLAPLHVGFTKLQQPAVDVLNEIEKQSQNIIDNPIPINEIPKGDNPALEAFSGPKLGKILRQIECIILERRAMTMNDAIEIALQELSEP